MASVSAPPAAELTSLCTTEPLSKYYHDMMETIGEGAYAAVTKHLKLGPDDKPIIPPHYVAVKQRKVSSRGMGFPHDMYREIKILNELQITHSSRANGSCSSSSSNSASSSSSSSTAATQPQHIVRLERVFMSPPSAGPGTVSLVYTYAEHDLSHLIRHHRKTNTLMPKFILKSVLAQLLSGLRVLHKSWIMHRDIKPQNVLIMGKGAQHGCVKIADFGLARIFQGMHEVRSLAADGDVVTIWYRAPELLLNSQHYTPAIDMWAVGCIFGEMLLRTPIFQGKEEKRQKGEGVRFQKDQLQKIFEVLGKVTPSHWPLVTKCPFYDEIKDLESPRFQNKLSQHLGKLVSDSGLQLLSQMLLYDPVRRITAEEALQHPFFSEAPRANMNNVFQEPGRGTIVFPYAAQRQGKPTQKAPQPSQPPDTSHHKADKRATYDTSTGAGSSSQDSRVLKHRKT